MNINNYKSTKLLFVLAVLSLVVPITVAAREKGKKENKFLETTYSGTIVTSNGRTLPFTMEVRKLTSDANAENDLNMLRSKGQDGFQKAIEKQDLGYFALEGDIAQTLRYVRETKTDEGTKLVAVFGRWLRPFELRYGTRSSDYPFTYIEIYSDHEGKSTGFAIGAARVQTNKENPNSIDFENFGALPAKLIGLQMKSKEL
ncbi:MAG: hypothetical protein R2747_18095 [Pyrinomonadaceae bacterium]